MRNYYIVTTDPESGLAILLSGPYQEYDDAHESILEVHKLLSLIPIIVDTHVEERDEAYPAYLETHYANWKKLKENFPMLDKSNSTDGFIL